MILYLPFRSLGIAKPPGARATGGFEVFIEGEAL